MSTMIMDLCSYTRLGLTGYLTSRGIKKQEIVEVNSAADLQKHCTSCCPAVVFLNEDCFVHDDYSPDHYAKPGDAVCYLYVAGEHPF